MYLSYHHLVVSGTDVAAGICASVTEQYQSWEVIGGGYNTTWYASKPLVQCPSYWNDMGGRCSAKPESADWGQRWCSSDCPSTVYIPAEYGYVTRTRTITYSKESGCYSTSLIANTADVNVSTPADHACYHAIAGSDDCVMSIIGSRTTANDQLDRPGICSSWIAEASLAAINFGTLAGQVYP